MDSCFEKKINLGVDFFFLYNYFLIFFMERNKDMKNIHYALKSGIQKG